jgi:hypothetical protein
MRDIKYCRTADRIAHLDVDTSGFIVRKRTPAARLSIAFMGLAACILMIVAIGFLNTLTGFYICMGSGLIIMFVAIHLERIRKIQLSTEFLNAIFSSALGKGYKFCIVARRDGEIIYVNRDFHNIFAHFVVQPALNIKQLCVMYGVSQEDCHRVESALLQSVPQTIGLHIQMGYVEPEPISLQIEPVDLPAGYMLVRGY